MGDSADEDNKPTDTMGDETLAASSMLPQTLGKYPILRILGRGGMGVVYLATHPELQIPVAIKTLPKELIEKDPAFVERFMVEARTAARIAHENVVRVFDVGQDGDVHYIVMEHVPGGSVRDLVRQGPLEVDRAIEITIGVAQALVAASRHGIVHRDIKPENILLDEHGTPKLADLGLAKGGQDGLDSGLTTTGIAMGTPHYMAPEQAKNAKLADVRADIYSLGGTLFHLLTGRPPYDDETSMGVLLKHFNEPVPNLKAVRPDVSEPLSGMVSRMLAKEPADRYPDAKSLLVDLRGLTKVGTSGKPIVVAPAPRSRVSRLLWVLAAVALLLMVAIGVLLATSVGGDDGLAEIVPVVDGGTPMPVADRALNWMDDVFAGDELSADWQRLSVQEKWGWEPLENLFVGEKLIVGEALVEGPTRDGWLTMVPKSTAWWMENKGPLLFKTVAGDFVATTRVEVSNRAGNGTPRASFSVAGLMARMPRDITPDTWRRGVETSVMLAIGSAEGDGETYIERKLTQQGRSVKIMPSTTDLLGESSGTMDARIVRLGNWLVSMIRLPNGDWQVMARDRIAGLPGELQIGLLAATDWSSVDDARLPEYQYGGVEGRPDLRAQFDYFLIRRAELPRRWPEDLMQVSDARIIQTFGEAFGTP